MPLSPTPSHAAMLDALEERLGITFKNRNLLVEAVTHRSYLNENQEYKRHNERLEFLGDAVLEIIVTEHLFRTFPDTPEGTLTNWRAAFVNAHRCAEVASEMDLEKCLLLSYGESKEAGTKAREYILANAFEALLGAVYLDQGIGACRMIVDAYLHAHATRIIESSADPKSTFQEMVQARWRTTPAYTVIRESGPDHDRHFLVAVCLGQIRVGEGEGSSKQEAQCAAAKKALDSMSVWEGRLPREQRKGKHDRTTDDRHERRKPSGPRR